MTQQETLVRKSLHLVGQFVLFNDSANSRNVNPLSHHNFVGSYGEKWLVNQFNQSGYIAQITPQKAHEGDLRVLDTQTGEYIKIEAKTALETTSGYGFCINKSKKTNCSYSDFVALICIDKQLSHYLYIIEPSLFNNSQFIRISSHPTRYAGKYAPFRVRGLINIDESRATHETWSIR